MWWTCEKNKHSPPFLTCHLTHFTPIPHSRKNKICEQDARTEHTVALPPCLCRVVREGMPPTFCPTHTRTGHVDTLQDPLGQINTIFNYFTTYPGYVR